MPCHIFYGGPLPLRVMLIQLDSTSGCGGGLHVHGIDFFQALQTVSWAKGRGDQSWWCGWNMMKLISMGIYWDILYLYLWNSLNWNICYQNRSPDWLCPRINALPRVLRGIQWWGNLPLIYIIAENSRTVANMESHGDTEQWLRKGLLHLVEKSM